MTFKLVLLFLCAAAGSAVGYAILCGYKQKFEYLNGIEKIISELTRNIAYRRDSAARVVSCVKIDSRLLKKNVEEYCAYADGVSELKISKGFLSDDVHSKVTELFSSLGGADGNTQMNELGFYAKEFGELRNVAHDKYVKYGSTAVKLGFLFGLGAGVLLL